MPINETYHTWIRHICELGPKQQKTQVQNFAWLLVGVFHSRSVSLRLSVCLSLTLIFVNTQMDKARLQPDCFK